MNRRSSHLNTSLVASTLFLICTLTGGLCAGQEITVAAASDLQFVMQDVAARFQKETGKNVKLIYGSSGSSRSSFKMGHPSICFFPLTSIMQNASRLRNSPSRAVSISMPPERLSCGCRMIPNSTSVRV